MLTINLVSSADGCEQTLSSTDTIFAKGHIMNLLKKIKNLIRKNERGSLTPFHLRDVSPMTPQQECTLRGLYYDCKNIKILLDEIDRRDEIIKKMDHEIWCMINRPGGEE